MNRPSGATCVFALALAGPATESGCFGAGEPEGPPFTIAGVGDGEKVTKNGAVPPSPFFWDPSARALKLHGGRNEVVAAQLVLTARGGDVPAVEVSVGAFEGPGTIPASSVELFRELYQFVADGSWEGQRSRQVLPDRLWYPEVLVPFRDPYDPSGKPVGSPFDLRVANGPHQGIWIDLYIPRDARPGRYVAPLTVRASGRAWYQATLVLIVHEFTLPDETHVDGYGEVYGKAYAFHDASFARGADRWWTVAKRYHQMAHRHRFVIAEREGEGPGLHEEELYDKTYGRLLDGTAFTSEEGFSGPGQATGVAFWRAPFAQKYDHVIPDFSERELEEYRSAAATFWGHCRRRGWEGKRFLVYVIDEADADARGREVTRKLQAALDAGAGPGRLHLMWTSHTNPATLAGDPRTDLRGVIRWWAPTGAACDPEFFRPLVAAGETVWFYHHGHPAIGVHAVNASGVELWTWGAICWRYGIRGSFWWAVDLGDGGDPLGKPNWSPQETRWGNGTLFYPGARLPDVGLPAVDGPLSSLRMKAYRRGLQDFEYAWLLEQAGKREAATAAFRRLIPVALTEGFVVFPEKRGLLDLVLRRLGAPDAPATPWAADPNAWYAARWELARALAP